MSFMHCPIVMPSRIRVVKFYGFLIFGILFPKVSNSILHIEKKWYQANKAIEFINYDLSIFFYEGILVPAYIASSNTNNTQASLIAWKEFKIVLTTAHAYCYWQRTETGLRYLKNLKNNIKLCSFILKNGTLMRIFILLFKTATFQFSLICFESIAI